MPCVPLSCASCVLGFSTGFRGQVDHKKTFFYLEQVILKHNAHANTIKIDQMPTGLDFYFKEKSHANKFVDFLSSIVPVTYVSNHRTNEASRAGRVGCWLSGLGGGWGWEANLMFLCVHGPARVCIPSLQLQGLQAAGFP
jgi:hypothetical protein